jgi:hypothetical protein
MTYTNSAILQSTWTLSATSDSKRYSSLRLKGLRGHVPHPNPAFEPHHILQMNDSMGDLNEVSAVLADQAVLGIGWLKTDEIDPASSVNGLSRRG